MGTREGLLEHLWRNVINSNLDEAGLQRVIEYSKKRPNDPFSDTGAAIERMISAGVSTEDICLVLRNTAYESVFSTLYAIGDPGVDGDDVFMLFEELLSADPSGMEGRPGSAKYFK